MLAFTIQNTPERKSKKQNNVSTPEPPVYLVLMPFSPPAKIFFENIKIGQEAVRTLKVRNPSPNLIGVILEKLPDPKLGLSLSQTEFVVESEGEIIIEIKFHPLIEGSGRECIHVKNINKNKKISDIFIHWSSIDPNPKQIKKKKPNLNKNNNLNLETKILKTNKVIAKKIGVKNVINNNNRNKIIKPQWKSTWPVESSYTKNKLKSSNKISENISHKEKISNNNNIKNTDGDDELPPCDVPGTPTRRQTYIVDNKENLDDNNGIYSNTNENKRNNTRKYSRDTILSPLPLLTKGRIKSKPKQLQMKNQYETNTHNKNTYETDNKVINIIEEEYDQFNENVIYNNKTNININKRNSNIIEKKEKYQECEKKRNLQVSYELLHLGSEDNDNDDIVYLGHKEQYKNNDIVYVAKRDEVRNQHQQHYMEDDQNRRRDTFQKQQYMEENHNITSNQRRDTFLKQQQHIKEQNNHDMYLNEKRDTIYKHQQQHISQDNEDIYLNQRRDTYIVENLINNKHIQNNEEFSQTYIKLDKQCVVNENNDMNKRDYITNITYDANTNRRNTYNTKYKGNTNNIQHMFEGNTNNQNHTYNTMYNENTHNQHTYEDNIYNQPLYIEEQITEIKITKTPIYNKTFKQSTRRNSFGKQHVKDNKINTSYDKNKSIEKYNGKYRIKKSSLGKLYNEYRRRSSDRFSIDSLDRYNADGDDDDEYVDIDVQDIDDDIDEGFNHQGNDMGGSFNIIEDINDKNNEKFNKFDQLNIQNTYKNIDFQLGPNVNIQEPETINNVNTYKLSENIFDSIKFEPISSLSDSPLSDNFNPRRTSTDCKQNPPIEFQINKKTMKNSKKTLNFLEKNNENFNNSLNEIKLITNNVFEHLKYEITPLKDRTNKSEQNDDVYVESVEKINNGTFDKDDINDPTQTSIKTKKNNTFDKTNDINNMKNDNISNNENKLKYINGNEINSDCKFSETFIKPNQNNINNITHIINNEVNDQTFNIKQNQTFNVIENNIKPINNIKLNNKQTTIERDSLDANKINNIQKQINTDNNFNVKQPYESMDNNGDLIKQTNEEQNQKKNITYERDSLDFNDIENIQFQINKDVEQPLEINIDTIDNANAVTNSIYYTNPFKNINDKLNSIEIDVIKYENKNKIGNLAQNIDLIDENVININNKAKNTNTIEKNENNIKENIDLSYKTNAECNKSEEQTSYRPSVWAIEISPPSKKPFENEDKLQPGKYNFLTKYPQTIQQNKNQTKLPIKKTIMKSRTHTLVKGENTTMNKTNTKLINTKDNHVNVKETDQETKIKTNRKIIEPVKTKSNLIKLRKSPHKLKFKPSSKSPNCSTSSSDRSKNSSCDLLENSGCNITSNSLNGSVSRKRRSNSNLDNEIVEKKTGAANVGPTPGKILKTSIVEDSFKRPETKSSTTTRSTSSHKAAGLPMRKLTLRRKMKPKEESIQFYNPEKIISDYTDSNLLIATGNSCTPFSVGSLYMDPKVLDDLERDNIKWLNSLLTPPIELECDAEGLWNVDIAALWLKSSRTQTVELAPSRETTAMKYHGQQHRLDALRKAAFQLFRSNKMSPVLSKLSWHISKNLIEIRKDRDLHLDQGLQQKVISLLLCYNPLWLRIGLEAVYGCTVPMNHNNDVVSLTSFMRKHLVSDPYTRKQHSHPKVPNLMDSTFEDAMKKFILRKFFMVVYFLDRAKTTKLIRHDPCLFSKKSNYKDSAQILIEFSRDLVSGGDILRHLRTIGYIVEHKQSYLNEFDFSTKTLLDLRDGVRLARAMEIILHKKYLTSKLRVPAISRLQKVHNVEISMTALQDAGYNIQDDITAKDIADGHREKTLSLLWQIIYKFQAPRYEKAARTIQLWWKSKSLFIEIKKRIRIKLVEKQNKAAVVIQSKWKGIFTRRRIIELKKQIEKEKSQRLAACILIQKTYRKYITQKKYLKLKQITIKIQKNYRNRNIINQDKINYIQLKQATIKIQKYYKNYLIMKNIKNNYINIRLNVIKIQNWYRNQKIMKTTRNNYVKYRNNIIWIQRNYKAKLDVIKQRNKYLLIKQKAIVIQRFYRLYKQKQLENYKQEKIIKSVIIIQKYYKNYLIMKKEQSNYINLKNNIIKIQRYWRNYQHMKYQRNKYIQFKQITIFIQRKYKAKLLMNKDKNNYNQLKLNTILIQRCFRNYITMKKERENYLNLKKSTIFIQCKFKANYYMKKQRNEYLNLKKSVCIIQNRFRANKIAQSQRQIYIHLKEKVIFIQRLFRANQLMKIEHTNFENYKNMKKSAIIIQNWFKGYLSMKKQRNKYLTLKKSACIIQNQYRANKIAQKQHKDYVDLKEKIVFIQRQFRANRQMKFDFENYQNIRNAIICIQKRYRDYLIMKKEREEFLNLRKSVCIIQNRFRANKIAQKQRQDYIDLKEKVVFIQRQFRANQLMKLERTNYLNIKNGTIIIQNYFKGYLAMKKQQEIYLNIKTSVIVIQKHYKSYKIGKEQRQKYIQLKNKVIFIQRLYRANKLMKIEQLKYKNYQKLKQATIIIQRRFKAILLMEKQRNEYLNLKKSVCIIQNYFRANKIAQKQRQEYINLKEKVVFIQRLFRANRQMKVDHRKYENYKLEKKSAIIIQTWFKSILLMKKQRNEFLKLRKLTCIIQNKFRANKIAQKQHKTYIAFKEKVVFIQRQFRANQLMKINRSNYINIRNAVVCIQNHYKNYITMKKQRNEFLSMKKSVLIIENYYKSRLLMLKDRNKFIQMKYNINKIQSWYLLKKSCQYDREKFLELKFFVIMIQKRYRFKLFLRKYSNVIEGLKLLKEKEKIEKYKNQCATKIQSLWRRYKIRKQFAEIIEKKKKTSQAQFENQAPLHVRLEEAFEGLNVGSDLFFVIKAVYNLDTITTLSPKLCIEFTNKGLIQHLYMYLQSANRSEPHKTMVTGILRVFINLARYELTSPIFWRITQLVDGLTTIIDLMKIWYAKNDELFCAATTLLWLFTFREEYIETILASENASTKLLFVYSQINKKKSKSSKLNLSLPGHKADWGLGYRRKVFTNPLFAITTVCKKLNLLEGKKDGDSNRCSTASTTSTISSSSTSRVLRPLNITKRSL